MITLENIKSRIVEELVDSIPGIEGKLEDPEIALMIDSATSKIMEELKLSLEYIGESGDFIKLEEELNEKLGL